jgi:hypothetical protein
MDLLESQEVRRGNDLCRGKNGKTLTIGFNLGC